MNWQVWRHGGAPHHNPRLIFAGCEAVARDTYHAVYLRLRQGTVTLIDPSGKVIRQYGAGRGRSPGNIGEVLS